MSVNTFKRGLSLPTRKHATEGRPVKPVPPSGQVVIPINQHFGAPNKSLVSVGDRVVRGMKIADAAEAGTMTVPVHASISGVVTKIEPRTQQDNTEGLCIVIEADGDGQEFMPPLDPACCTKEEALTRIREAGIIGMGGAGFPTYVKLSPQPGKKIDLIIANGAECEPYLTTDEATVTEKHRLLVKGLGIIMKITGVNRAIIGIEENKRRLVPVIERALGLADMGGSVSVELCRVRYPQGSEKMLVTALTGREVPSGGLPPDVGCIVQNVGTIIAIAEAVTLGKPLIDRDLTVSGGACKTPKNIRAPVGALIKDMPAEFMDVDYGKLSKIVFGGPMMGDAVPSLDVPIQKNTSGIILMTKEETNADAEGPCIRCGRCMRSCPYNLAPVILNNNLDANDLDAAVKTGLSDCIECGNCAYVCPARIKLVQRFRIGKQTKEKRGLLLGSSPHIASPVNSVSLMRNMLIALTPVSAFGVIVFGLPALLNIIVAVAAAILGESLFRLAIRQPVRAKDLSSGVTGLLLALIIPPSMPLWMTALGSLFAVIVAKEFFGGLGANVFNPALIGRAFLLMSFPVAMTKWHHAPESVFPLALTDAVSHASPLGIAAAGRYTGNPGPYDPSSPEYWAAMKELFFGYHSGSSGETSILLILAAFLFLLVTKTVDWRAPVFMVATAAAASFALGLDPLFAVLSGGLVFGAVFMATDYVTAPVTPWGKVIFGAGAGLITVLIRKWGIYPEGASYGILIMNCAVPFLNKLLARKYGYVSKKETAGTHKE